MFKSKIHFHITHESGLSLELSGFFRSSSGNNNDNDNNNEYFEVPKYLLRQTVTPARVLVIKPPSRFLFFRQSKSFLKRIQ